MNKKAIAYYVLQEYDKALLELNKSIQLDSNSLAYYYKGFKMENISDAIVAFGKCIELDPDDDLARLQFNYLEYLNSSKYEDDIMNLNGKLYQFQDDSNR